MAEYLELEKVLDDNNIITVQTREYGSIEVIPVDTITDIELADVQPVDRWISVDERLPNTDERVLVYIPKPDNHYNIEIAYISEGNDDYPYWVLRDKSQFYSTRFYYISRWQPLPEPPKDSDTNG